MSPGGRWRRPRQLTSDRSWRLIFAQAEEDGMTHVAVLRPFLKGDFAYEGRIYPLDRHVGLRFHLERALRLDQRLELGAYSFQAVGVEATADVADVNQFALVEDTKHKRAQFLARAARLRETA